MRDRGQKRQRLLVLLRVLWCEIAALAVVLTGDVSWWLSTFILVLIPLVGLAPESSPWLKPARTLSSILAIFYLFFFPLDWLVISRQLIFAVVHLIFYLKMHSLLHLQTERERYRLYVLCLFEMLAAASMTVSVAFLFPFVLFVLLGSLVLILEQSVLRAEAESRSPPIRAAVRAAMAVGVALIVVAGAIFVALPRTTYGGFRVSGMSGITQTGLAGEIQLGDFGEIKLNRDVVMRVMGGGGRLVTPPRWRGAAYDRYEEGRWRQTLTEIVVLPKLLRPGEFLLDRPTSGPRVTNQVFLEPLDTDVIFVPPASLELAISLPTVFVDPYLTVRSGRFGRAGRRYTVTWRGSRFASSSSLGGVERMEVWRRQVYLQLPTLSDEFHQLAGRWSSTLTRLDTATAIETYLKETYGYSLTTPTRARSDPIEDFLFNARAGHCEYFATAMVMLLRSQRIPSRLVTGFGRGERNEFGDFEVVRKSDAHAWVEVFDEQQGWMAFDPTPAAPSSTRSRAFEILFERIDSLRLLWDVYIIAFDYERQRDVWGRVSSGLRSIPISGGFVIDLFRRWAKVLAVGSVLLGFVLFLSRTRFVMKMRLKLRIPWPFRMSILRTRPEAAVRFYEDLLRRLEKLGFSKPAGMTPAEFAGSLEERLPGISELTQLYYRVRFGGVSLRRDQLVRAERLLTAIQVTALAMADLARGVSKR